MSSVRKLTADELGSYAERLAETFGGARYKVAVAIWPVSGPVELAVAYVIDLHDSSSLRIAQDGRKYLAPLYRFELFERSEDGSPVPSEAQAKAHIFLDGHDPDWSTCQGGNKRYVCVDSCVPLPANLSKEEIRGFLYPILL